MSYGLWRSAWTGYLVLETNLWITNKTLIGVANRFSVR
jgi:hypothetical protein